MKLVYTAQAVESLKRVYEFLCRDNACAAVIIHNDILNEVERLQVFPQMASIEPMLKEEPEGFRSLVVGSHYKIIYYVDRDMIIVVDVWDCRREP